MTEEIVYPYYYCFRNNEKRSYLVGRSCRVISRGKMNSVLIEFEDDKHREVVSRYAIRKIKHPPIEILPPLSAPEPSDGRKTGENGGVGC